jgi:dUTP pyrophosphatase
MLASTEVCNRQSACFELSFSASGKVECQGYNKQNKIFTRKVSAKGSVHAMPGDRLLIPTGLILDIPEGYSVRINPRSGLSLKQGLVLANTKVLLNSELHTMNFFLS